MRGELTALIPVLILVGWAAAIFWASIMAIRGKRMWATSLLVIGAACMLVGTLAGVAATITFTSAYSFPDLLQFLLPLGWILVMIGLVVISIGFVGVCARFGLAEKRAEELEVLVVQLQQRIGSSI